MSQADLFNTPVCQLPPGALIKTLDELRADMEEPAQTQDKPQSPLAMLRSGEWEAIAYFCQYCELPARYQKPGSKYRVVDLDHKFLMNVNKSHHVYCKKCHCFGVIGVFARIPKRKQGHKARED